MNAVHYKVKTHTLNRRFYSFNKSMECYYYEDKSLPKNTLKCKNLHFFSPPKKQITINNTVINVTSMVGLCIRCNPAGFYTWHLLRIFGILSLFCNTLTFWPGIFQPWSHISHPWMVYTSLQTFQAGLLSILWSIKVKGMKNNILVYYVHLENTFENTKAK